ncbi:MAG: hypothetical protein LBB05_01375 [Puniceicoccales bacterium]|jgi:hypothetical protein|nr:hypothetical protein [Puniceicoccales bacterium]
MDVMNYNIYYLSMLCLATPCFGSVAGTDGAQAVASAERSPEEIVAALDVALAQVFETNNQLNALWGKYNWKESNMPQWHGAEISRVWALYIGAQDQIITQLSELLDKRRLSVNEIEKYLFSQHRAGKDSKLIRVIESAGGYTGDPLHHHTYALVVKLADKGYYDLVKRITLKCYSPGNGGFNEDDGYEPGAVVPLGYMLASWPYTGKEILDKMPPDIRAEMENAFFHVYRLNGRCDGYGVFGGGCLGVN